jgi:actin-like ATPase involved in cell morphogenesis
VKPEDIVSKIIKEQGLIIGEQLARQMAKDSGVVQFNSSKIEDITITSTDSPAVIDRLINSYRNLFGQASVDVCLDVIRKIPNGGASTLLSDSVKNRLASMK